MGRNVAADFLKFTDFAGQGHEARARSRAMPNGIGPPPTLTRRFVKHLAACPNLNMSGFVRAAERRLEISNA